MASPRQLQIVAVCAPVVNATEVALSLRTQNGDGLALVCSRHLARALALSILEATGPVKPAGSGAGQPVTSRVGRRKGVTNHGGHNRSPAAVLASLREHYPAYARRELTLREVGGRVGLSFSTVGRYYRQWDLAEAARGPVLKPGGALL
jgi:hypothetical protein